MGAVTPLGVLLPSPPPRGRGAGGEGVSPSQGLAPSPLTPLPRSGGEGDQDPLLHPRQIDRDFFLRPRDSAHYSRSIGPSTRTSVRGHNHPFRRCFMSQCSRPVPVGILVSVSGPPRRRRTSIDKLPSIRKEVNLPLRVGIGVGVALTVLVALTSLVAYGVNRRAPVHVVAQVRNDAVVRNALAPVETPVAIAAVEPAAPPPAPRFV